MNYKLNICLTCEEFNTETKKCKQCGCYMPLKTLVPGMKCQLNKWEPKTLTKSLKL